MSTPQDEHRFTALFDDTYADLLRFVRRRHGEDGAEDVVAEVLLTAWRRFEDLPAAADDARAWVFGIARGTMANSRRGAHRRAALGVRLAQDGPSVADAPDGLAALTIDLARAWDVLSARDQEVLALAVLDGLTSAGAAHVLGTTPVAYRLRLSRARRRLRRLLEGASPPTGARVHGPIADTAWEATS